jgi:cytochrome b561
MTAWRNSSARYGLVAIALHWTIALAIIGMLGLGVIMADMSPASPLKFQLYQWHKSIGISILALSLLRLGWRLANPVPAMPAGMRRWEIALARLTHGGFYLLMLALPLSGWAMVSASPWNIPTVLYGVVELPHLPLSGWIEDRKSTADALKEVHEWLGWGVAALLALHVAGALKHHLIVRDDTLMRMLPWRTRRTPAAGE